MLNVQEVNFLQHETEFWHKLSANEQALLKDNAVCQKQSQGVILHSGTQKCLGALIIKVGQVRIYSVSDTGREITLYRLNPGDVCMLSASCVLENITLDILATTEKDSEIIFVNANVFATLISQNLALENYCLKLAVTRMSGIVWALEQILFMSMDRRLAGFLLEEAEKTQADSVKLTHEQIAKYIGSAREVVSRMLKYFEQEGMVQIARGSITLVDKKRLSAI